MRYERKIELNTYPVEDIILQSPEQLHQLIRDDIELLGALRCTCFIPYRCSLIVCGRCGSLLRSVSFAQRTNTSPDVAH